MKKYVIKFEHVEESEYTAIVEANSYEEAMDIFEESPFEYLEDEEPDSVQGYAFHVSEVTEDDNIVHKDSKNLVAMYQ
jgi:hypothetical protein